VTVEVVPVTREDLKRVSASTPAEILPFEQTNLYAKVSGYVKDIHVDIGDRVKKDAVLAVLWVPEMDKELEQKKALVVRSEAQVLQAQEAANAAEANVQSATASLAEMIAGRARVMALHERWKSEYQRLRTIVQKQVLDQQQLEETEYQYKAAASAVEEVEAKIKSAQALVQESQAKLAKARADVKVAQAQVLVDKADRDLVETMQQYTRVVAPYDGVVTRRNLHTGAFSNARTSEQPLIFTIVRTDKVRVTVDIPEKDARFLDLKNPGKHAVHVELDALPGKKCVWRLTRFAPLLGAGKKVRAEMEIENSTGELFPGMYGHAVVTLEERPGALVLPASCLSGDSRGAFVFTVAENQAKKVYVGAGLNDGKKVEITSGLTGSEMVVGSGKEALHDGQAVTPRPVKVGRIGNPSG
jgi:RND family efflux transporter MFP subunit